MTKLHTIIMSFVIILTIPYIGHSDLNRMQSFHLEKGWNAIFLEINPEEKDTDKVFSSLAIDQVATFYPQSTSVQYIKDPSENWKHEGWLKWVPPDSPYAFLKNLYHLHAAQAYLIHASETIVWQVKGEATFSHPRWRPNSFNLTGFYIDPDNPPSFATYFENSKAHAHLLIYDLINNQWKKITDPQTHFIQSGKAYWVYCQGESDYMGPLDITLPMEDALAFHLFSSRLRIDLKNTTEFPITCQFESIAGLNNEPNVSLSLRSSHAVQNVISDDLSNNSQQTLESEQQKTLYFEVRRDRMQTGTYHSLLKLRGGGSCFYIPVSAIVIDKVSNSYK